MIFFDEIQEYPKIATSLKIFKIDGRFDVIYSGSLLGTNYRQIESNSVGYKTDCDMYALDFEEFLWARGYDDTVVEDMLAHMKNKERVKSHWNGRKSLELLMYGDICNLGFSLNRVAGGTETSVKRIC